MKKSTAPSESFSDFDARLVDGRYLEPDDRLHAFVGVADVGDLGVLPPGIGGQMAAAAASHADAGHAQPFVGALAVRRIFAKGSGSRAGGQSGSGGEHRVLKKITSRKAGHARLLYRGDDVQREGVS